MPVFCELCGNLIEDGETCNCNNEDNNENNKISAFENIKLDEPLEFTDAAPELSKESIHIPTSTKCEKEFGTFKAIVSFLKYPITFTLETYKRLSFYTSMSLICIEALAASIAGLIFISLLNAKHSTFLFTIDRILGLGGMVNPFAGSLGIVKKEIFIKIFILVYILFFILAGLFYICGKLFGKEEGHFKHVISFLSISSITFSIAFIISAIILPLFPSLIPYVLAYTFLIGLIINDAASDDLFNIGHDKTIFSTSLAYLAFCFIINVLTVETLRTAINYFYSFTP